MRRYLWLEAMVLVVLLAPLGPRPQAQGTILFQPDYSAGAFPQAGWDRAISEKFGVRWTRSYLPTGGPFGGPAHRLTELPRTTDPDCGGQHGWGWDVALPTDPPRGVAGRRYVRWAIRYVASSNFLAAKPQPDCAASMTSDKLMMVGDGCNSGNCRIILTAKVMPDEASNPERRKLQFGVAIDGGTAQTETGYVIDTSGWLFVQLELTPSTSTTVLDGGWRLFVNNNATPIVTRTGIRLDPENWRHISFGAYNNNVLRANGTNAFDTALFEVATGFDPNWYRTGGSTSPSPTAPSGARIVP